MTWLNQRLRCTSKELNLFQRKRNQKETIFIVPPPLTVLKLIIVARFIYLLATHIYSEDLGIIAISTTTILVLVASARLHIHPIWGPLARTIWLFYRLDDSHVRHSDFPCSHCFCKNSCLIFDDCRKPRPARWANIPRSKCLRRFVNRWSSLAGIAADYRQFTPSKSAQCHVPDQY